MLPARVLRAGDRLIVQRADTAGHWPLRPHFGAAIDGMARDRRHAIDLVPLDDLPSDASTCDRVSIVLHVTRCGSTLFSRMLGQIGSVGMISEAPAVADLLRHEDLPAAQRIDGLRRLVSAMLAPFAARRRSPVIRFASWAIWFLPEIRRAFPAAPVILLYRDPVEVAVSQSMAPSSWLNAGWLPACAGGVVDASRFATGNAGLRCEMMGRILAAWFDAVAASNSDHPLRLIDYPRLTDHGIDQAIRCFGITPPTPAERQAMTAETRFDAKAMTPVPFQDDRAAKQAALSPALRQAVDRHAMPALARLQAVAG